METKKNIQTVGDVLIADDDPKICEVIKQYCINLGCFRNIVIAYDGALASNKLRNQKFKIIFLDMKMPKKAGLDVIREFDDKTLNQKSSILIVSGEIDKTILEKTVGLGVKNFLMKPFTEEEFQERVLKMIK
jgi:two-component system chemotaxis response regulator CheY